MLLLKDPTLACAVRHQARRLSSLHFRPDGFRAVDGNNQHATLPVAPPVKRAAALSQIRRRTFATTVAPAKAVARIVTQPESFQQLPRSDNSPFKASMLPHEKAPRTAAAEAVARGRRRGRTLKSLSLEGKLCVVVHTESTVSSALAATFLDSGADDIVVITRQAESLTTRSSAPPDRLASSPAAVLRQYAASHGYTKARIVDLPVLGHTDEADSDTAAAQALERIGQVFGSKRQIDVLCFGPPRDEEDARMCVPFLRHVAEAMANKATSEPYEAPNRNASVILVSSPYGPRVDLPQPQPLGVPGGGWTPVSAGNGRSRHAGAAEMSRLARALGAEFASRHVRFNAISPGFVRTPEVETLLDRDPSLESTWREATPLGRIGGVEELKGAAALLASDASRFTTGANLVIDGGFSLV